MLLKLSTHSKEGALPDAEALIDLDTFAVDFDYTKWDMLIAHPAFVSSILHTFARVVRDEGGNGTSESAMLVWADEGGEKSRVFRVTFEEVPA